MFFTKLVYRPDRQEKVSLDDRNAYSLRINLKKRQKEKNSLERKFES